MRVGLAPLVAGQEYISDETEVVADSDGAQRATTS